MARYENKTLDKLMQRLTDNGELMIDIEGSYAEYGCFGQGTKSHWICLQDNYRFYDGLIAIHEQLDSMVCELKNGKIYKMAKPEVLNQHNVYIKDDDGNDKNYNPFSNGTYKRRGK
jgi:hypothetical protein|tara:strand:+ start:246 stop:593 length:348 start_codon:yes stop_codon:yes gene_type:complete